ncbi:dehydrogenase E1 component subunit alpha/beta [Paeniglutamicibacter sp. ABSL32-1]|uniref:alpha-ketoacid dehydrogenase subunit alpha/beta n=1 Tax=Paeniglutamicibacter quisquiliarum TaxID=2849498 RepID=UPI001C2D7A75|nr:dehydrogenase E1 component subunit alpha/beta [Paeniglutamicibacter quisquiliarum]MBV1781054.1 dehydrogenase E1 component subunit alpha/beta [Paeniglutamicibacter quisquiliarum]
MGTDESLHLLEEMVLIRQFEQTAYLRYLQGEIPGTLHQSQGQEAVAVGVCSLLRTEDWITSTHRPHGHALAKGLDPAAGMAEIYGRETGCLGGRGGSMHLGDPALGILPSIAIVGGGITIAPGLAHALKHKGTDNVVVCFFGDGAVNEGAFHEGVNYAAALNLPVIFVCENNMYGASTPFHETTRNINVASRGESYGIPSEQADGMDVRAVRGAMQRALETARSGKGPVLLEFLTYRYVGHSRGDARGYRTKEEEAYWTAKDPIKTFGEALVEEGTATEEQVKESTKRAKKRIAEALKHAQQAPWPDPETALAPNIIYGNPPQKVEGAGPLAEDGEEDRFISIAESIRETLHRELATDPDLVLLGEDVGVPGGFGGAFGVYQGLAEEYGRDRVIDTPISEKAIIGASIGAAIGGMRTVPDLQYADFVFEAMDELVNEAAKQRYMSNGKLTIPMVLRCPVGASQRGAQHSQCPESFFMHVPGIKVLCISDPYTAKGALTAAIRDDDPVLVFEHKLLYGAKRQEAGSINTKAYVPEENFALPVGQARVRRRGKHATVVATFTELYKALELAEKLAEEGIELEVIDPVWLNPFDWDTVMESVKRTGRLVIAHEAHLTGGWGAEVSARVSDELFADLKAPVRRVASRDIPMPFSPPLEAAVLPLAEHIEAAVREVLSANHNRTESE